MKLRGRLNDASGCGVELNLKENTINGVGVNIKKFMYNWGWSEVKIK